MTRVIVSVARTAIRLLFVLHPAAFRRAYGAEVLEAVERDIVAARPLGPVRQVRTALAATWDATRASAAPRPAKHEPRAASFLAHDTRIAWRQVRANRGTSLAVAGTLCLAIAAAVSMFGIAEAALLRPLPFADGERLVRLEERTAAAGRAGVSIPAFDIWQRELPSLASAAFYEPRESTVTVRGEPERLAGAGVSREIFAVLGVAPEIGRTFSAGPRFGPPDEAVISQRLYERLGGTPAVLGTSIAIDPHTYSVVGVMPRGFDFPASADFWVTAKGMGPLETERSLRFLETVGRLQPDATLRQLQGELALVDARYPASDRVGGRVRMAAFSLRDAFVGTARPAMRMALMAVALLLLVACSNVAALVLARTSARSRDLAVHRAIGASRLRITSQCSIEMLILALPAGLAGTLIAWRAQEALAILAQDQIPGIGALRINTVVAAFAVAVTAASALVSAVAPSVFAARIPAMASLSGRYASASQGLLRSLRALVIAQVALGFVVTICGALLTRSVARLVNADHGFDPSRVAVARINFPIRTPAARAAQVPYYAAVLERARALPDVVAAGLVSRIPMSTVVPSADAYIDGDTTRAVRAVMQTASTGALPAIGARFIAGGDLPAAQDAIPAVVINDELARLMFPGRNPIDRQITFRFYMGPVTARVAGVVRAVRYNGLSGDPMPCITLDYRAFQFPMSLVARTSSDADRVLPELRGIVRGADATKRVTVDQLTTLDREVSRVLARPRFFTAVMVAFSAVVLAISCAGVFGLLSFWVGQRRRELGIRLALGAPSRRLLLGVTLRAFAIVAAGVALGAAAASVVTRSMSSMLFGVGRADPLSFAVCTLLFLVAAMIAAAVPARRAGRVDPLTVLRSD